VLQSAVIWGMALVVGPMLLLRLERGAGIQIDSLHRPTAGAVLFAGFSLLNVTTGMVLAVRGRGTPLPLATARELVVVGPYRYVRNPMAVAGIGQGVAVALWLGSLLTLAYSIAGAIVWHTMVRPAEERDLSARFDGAYDAYRAAVPLWRPRLVPFHPNATQVTSRSFAGAQDDTTSRSFADAQDDKGRVLR
jgi:protein-S-isoprenylcysteine O-methyltransferase Ste14